MPYFSKVFSENFTESSMRTFNGFDFQKKTIIPFFALQSVRWLKEQRAFPILHFGKTKSL